MSDSGPPKNRKELYERIARGGKDEVILEEMVRLGFWPNTSPPPADPPDEVRRMNRVFIRMPAHATCVIKNGMSRPVPVAYIGTSVAMFVHQSVAAAPNSAFSIGMMRFQNA